MLTANDKQTTAKSTKSCSLKCLLEGSAHNLVHVRIGDFRNWNGPRSFGDLVRCNLIYFALMEVLSY